MLEKTFTNFDNPNAPWNKDFTKLNLPLPRDPRINIIRYTTIPVDYISLILNDDTVTDFTDCRVHDYPDSIEILTKDNKVITYFHTAIKGYIYTPKSYEPLTDC